MHSITKFLKKRLLFLIYKTLPSNFEKTTVFSNVCFPALVWNFLLFRIQRILKPQKQQASIHTQRIQNNETSLCMLPNKSTY